MVSECDRRGCDNIGCKRYSNKYGYICDECFEELLFWRDEIGSFMFSEKISQNEKGARKIYHEKIFPK